MKKILAIILICCGCAAAHPATCRHKAVYAALIMGEKYPVRIARGPAYEYKQWHAQAQAFIDDKWQPLCLCESGVYVCEAHAWFEPLIINTVSRYIERQFKPGVNGWIK